MKKERTKILFWGDAVTPTGFAKVLHSIARYLPKDQYSISWLGVNYFGDPHKYTDLRIYPAASKRMVYGENRLEEIVKTENPDILFILNDAWVIAEFLKNIKRDWKDGIPFKIITYIPVDAEEHDPEWYVNFDVVSKIIAYTPFGKKEIEEASGRKDIEVIQHGVDTSIFYKINEPKEKIKKELLPKKEENYKDSFVVLNANRNQPRKRIDITMEAFKLFSENKPDNVKLYLHMGYRDAHIDVLKKAKRLDMEGRLILTSLNAGVQQSTEEKLNRIYNACDVGINTGIGEGWGLVQTEHAVTGAPQIVGEHSSLIDLYKDCGILVPSPTRHTIDNIMTVGRVPSLEYCVIALETLYRDKDLYQKLSEASIKKFMSKEYSWKYITGLWENVFKSCL